MCHIVFYAITWFRYLGRVSLFVLVVGYRATATNAWPPNLERINSSETITREWVEFVPKAMPERSRLSNHQHMLGLARSPAPIDQGRRRLIDLSLGIPRGRLMLVYVCEG